MLLADFVAKDWTWKRTVYFTSQTQLIIFYFLHEFLFQLSTPFHFSFFFFLLLLLVQYDVLSILSVRSSLFQFYSITFNISSELSSMFVLFDFSIPPIINFVFICVSCVSFYVCRYSWHLLLSFHSFYLTSNAMNHFQNW